jgi:uncharacterized protein YutE (UPF0331/DUF86 family)
MNVDSKIITRLDDLIELGQKVTSTRRPPASNVITSDFVDVQLANQWFTSCLNLFSRVFGENSEFYKNLKGHYVNSPKWPNVNQAFGVLLAAKDDFVKDSIFELKTIVEAELFDDFIEQSDHLLNSGYYQSAAVIAGSVLEDGLRKICIRNNIELPNKPKLDSMNSELAKAGVYNKLTQKKLTALADIRNSAAHGQWDAFDETDVKDMISSVRSFMEKNYA